MNTKPQHEEGVWKVLDEKTLSDGTVINCQFDTYVGGIKIVAKQPSGKTIIDSALYCSLAVCQVGGRLFAAGTEYWQGTLPCNQLIELKAVANEPQTK